MSKGKLGNMGFIKKLFKYKTVYPKKYFNFKVVKDYEIRPLYDLKDNLIYMHCEILHECDSYSVFFKEYNNIMYKYVLINDLESYKSNHLSDELIVAYNLGRKFKYDFKVERIGKIKTVEIYIIADLTLEAVKYSITTPKQTKDLFQMVLVYDNEYHRLLQFQYSKETNTLFSEFKIAMYKDINAKDKEDY